MTIYSSVSYLQKNRFLPRQITRPPATQLSLVVVIPCRGETSLLQTLDAIEACDSPKGAVEVLVVLNAEAAAPSQVIQLNLHTLRAFTEWNRAKRWTYHLIVADNLSEKHAGIGLARKIGLDEAVDRLAQAGAEDGILLCLDADTLVAPSYLRATEALLQDRKGQAWCIDFRHPTSAEEDSGPALPLAAYEGIIRYELAQRYYVEGLRWAGYPMAYHTLGTAMAIRSSAYQAQGGMNRRRAGEDFYFLHKFSLLGTLRECHTTEVFPSPRASEGIPFGTGKAITQWLEQPTTSWPVAAPDVFVQIKALIQRREAFRYEWPEDLSPVVDQFLRKEGLPEALVDMRLHGRSKETFLKRWYAWLHPLKMLQLYRALEEAVDRAALFQAASDLLHAMGLEGQLSGPALLDKYRQRQSAHWPTPAPKILPSSLSDAP